MNENRVKILLVEDSPSDAQLLSESLVDYPWQAFEIVRAERLEEALALLTQGAFDVVLLDLNLPDSSGTETCRRMSEAAAGVPIIILTGAEDERIVSEAVRLGIQDYLVKGQSSGGMIGRTIRYAVERCRVQQALRRSEERVWATFNNAGVGLAEVERDDRIIAVNDRLCEILGYERQELLGQTIHVLTAPEDRADSDVRNRQLHEGKTNRIAYDKRYLRRDGTRLWVHVTVSAIHDADGCWLRSIGTIEDISERRRAEESLHRLTATLESKVAQRTAELEHRARQLQKLALELSQIEDRERKRLAEILHDDLQQILAAAKFHLSLLRNRVKQDPALHTATGQIDQMLKDAIAKSRSLSHELSPALLYQGDFVATLRWLAGQMQAKYGLAVQIHAPGPVYLQSDALRGFLYKTAQELLFNAVKHAHVREVRVRVRPCDSHVCLSVSDRGRGFDPAGLLAVSGFGLLSIRERTELLGGRMKIRSGPGRGSTFFVAVPNEEPQQETGSTPESRRVSRSQQPDRCPGDRPCGSRLRVLLADDHEIVRQGLVSLLREQDEVEIVGEATNGQEAVDLTDRLRPDVVIMDVSMPVMNGAEATSRIKKDRPRTRVVSLSMWEEPEVRERMYRAGAESYVLKTAPAEELLAAIRGKGTNP